LLLFDVVIRYLHLPHIKSSSRKLGEGNVTKQILLNRYEGKLLNIKEIPTMLNMGNLLNLVKAKIYLDKISWEIFSNTSDLHSNGVKIT
jgi:hypothetical protein